MRGTVATILAIAASTAQAISITYPTENATVDASSGLTVTWDTVSTDPSTVDITIVGTSNGQQTTSTVASGVSTSSGSYTIDSLDVDSGSGFQIDFISTDDKNTGILAQSEQFIVDNTGSSSSTTASAASTASTLSTFTTSATSGTSSATTAAASSNASAAAAASSASMFPSFS